MNHSILIATEVLDVHAVAADVALRDMGHDVVRLFAEDLPQKLAGSFTVEPGTKVEFDIKAPGLDRSFGGFDTVWFRRPAPPALPMDLLHPDDIAPASQENGFFIDGIWSYLGRDAFWINPLDSRRASRSKILQLAEAVRLGFEVPRTLASNDPVRIREFIRSNPPRETVFKAFEGHFWDVSPGVRFINYTTAIDEAALPSDAMLRAVPGMFQRRIHKAFELRVTCFGRHAVAAKLLSQIHEFTSLDWRGVDPRYIPIEPYDLPPQIAERCWLLMQRLGIVFGCFDFIVTPQGDHIFLEVNEMGQFLWVEEVNPDFRLLDTFVDFVCARTGEFEPRRKAAAQRISFHDIASRPEYRAAIEFDVKHHIGLSIRQAPAAPADTPKRSSRGAAPVGSAAAKEPGLAVKT